jgi:hypothetical protein
VALGREGINISAIAQGSSECNISVVVAQKDMKAALLTLHREFQLSAATPEVVRSASSAVDEPEFSLPLAQATESELAQGMD